MRSEGDAEPDDGGAAVVKSGTSPSSPGHLDGAAVSPGWSVGSSRGVYGAAETPLRVPEIPERGDSGGACGIGFIGLSSAADAGMLTAGGVSNIDMEFVHKAGLVILLSRVALGRGVPSPAGRSGSSSGSAVRSPLVKPLHADSLPQGPSLVGEISGIHDKLDLWRNGTAVFIDILNSSSGRPILLERWSIFVELAMNAPARLPIDNASKSDQTSLRLLLQSLYGKTRALPIGHDIQTGRLRKEQLRYRVFSMDTCGGVPAAFARDADVTLFDFVPTETASGVIRLAVRFVDEHAPPPPPSLESHEEAQDRPVRPAV